MLCLLLFKGDANPRAIYEAFLAGLPALISHESRVPGIVQKQGFVVMTNSSEGSSRLNLDLASFMDVVEGRDEKNIDHQIDNFIQEEMEEKRSLQKMCIRMGICIGSWEL